MNWILGRSLKLITTTISSAAEMNLSKSNIQTATLIFACLLLVTVLF